MKGFTLSAEACFVHELTQSVTPSGSDLAAGVGSAALGPAELSAWWSIRTPGAVEK